jgi:drug/metabolite transporter (DMT)-like permease
LQNGSDSSGAPQSALMRLLTSPITALIATAFLWSTTTVVVRYFHEEMPPLSLSFWRTFTAFLILLPFAAPALRTQWPLVIANLKWLALLALLLWVGGNALLFLSLQYTIAINAAVINSTEPIFIVLFAALIFRDPFTWKQGAGFVLSLAGVLALISGGSVEQLRTLEFNIGDLIVTFAYVSWGLYVVFLRKVPQALDHRLLLWVLLGFGALFMLPLHLFEITFVRPMPVNGTVLTTVIALAIFPGVLSMLMWNYGIKKLGGARAGQFIHTIPAFTIVLALVFLDEALRQFHIIGMILIAAGLVVASRR